MKGRRPWERGRPRPPKPVVDARGARGPTGWHWRGYLPHFESDEAIQMITYRLADALPRAVAERLAYERSDKMGDAAYRQRIEAWLDAGHGACVLRDPAAAQIVDDSWRRFDGVRYRLHAWVIMPNHVHVLVHALAPHPLHDVIKGWKGFTAREIGKRVRRPGATVAGGLLGPVHPQRAALCAGG